MNQPPFRARNIITGEVLEFNNYHDAHIISGIGPHSIVNNYLNQPIHHNGWVYYSHDHPYWQPPPNFKFDPDIKSTIPMNMCKSINLLTGETTYYSSITEAAKFIGLVGHLQIRKLGWYIKNYVHGKTAEDETIGNYKWYKVRVCGSWIHDNGEDEIDELIIVETDTETGVDKSFVTLEQLETI